MCFDGYFLDWVVSANTREELQNFRIMLTERDLLLDIIQNAPENSVWNISSDSWERIPEVFLQYIVMNDVYGWDITINKDNREHLLKIIDQEEIYDKIVHQNIMFNIETIFKSYDRMTGSYLKKSFPRFDDIMQKYQEKDQDFEVLEL